MFRTTTEWPRTPGIRIRLALSSRRSRVLLRRMNSSTRGKEASCLATVRAHLCISTRRRLTWASSRWRTPCRCSLGSRLPAAAIPSAHFRPSPHPTSRTSSRPLCRRRTERRRSRTVRRCSALPTGSSSVRTARSRTISSTH